MPTTRPRAFTVLHRFTDRTLKAYAAHHGLSLSEVVSFAALMLARIVKQEADERDEATGARQLTPEMLFDLYRTHPDYDPNHAEADLSKAAAAFAGTIGRLKSWPSSAPSVADLQAAAQRIQRPSFDQVVHSAAEASAERNGDRPQATRTGAVELPTGLEAVFAALDSVGKDADAVMAKHARRRRSAGGPTPPL